MIGDRRSGWWKTTIGVIVTAVMLFVAGVLMDFFARDYALIGRLTSLLFILGIVGIWLAPDTSEKQLED